MVLGGQSKASCVTMGGKALGIAAGGSTGGGFCLLVRETCAMILAPGTTCVSRPTINPAQASSAPLPRDSRRWLPTIRFLGDASALLHNGLRSPLVSDLSRPAKDLNVVFSGDAVMASQFGQAPHASLLDPALGTGATSVRPFPRAPHNVHLGGTLFRSTTGARALSPSSAGRQGPFAMA